MIIEVDTQAGTVIFRRIEFNEAFPAEAFESIEQIVFTHANPGDGANVADAATMLDKILSVVDQRGLQQARNTRSAAAVLHTKLLEWAESPANGTLKTEALDLMTALRAAAGLPPLE